MINKLPFIYKFRTSKNAYVYDVNSNNLIRVEDKVYSVIDSKEWKNNELIINALNEGIISNKRPSKIVPTIDYREIKEILENNIQRLILFVADQCNLSCAYCYYSDSYGSTKNLKGNLMDWNMAKDAIDFYLSRSKENDKSKEQAICFYGGEPFLNFGIIRKSVEYVKNRRKGIPIAISTNLTLLDNDILKFLIDKHIFLSVSLDGPKELHDRYRVFKNGQGSFDKVIENLKKIYKRDKEYFYNNLVFNVIAAPPIDYVKIHNFFSKEDLFSKSWFANVGKISYTGEPRFKEKYGIDRTKGQETEKELFKMFEEKVVKEGTCKDKFLFRFYYQQFWRLYNRRMQPFPKIIKERSACIPGQLRLLVDPSGDLYPCEKGISTFKIGSIEEGINYDKCFSLVREYTNIRTKLCTNCWAIRFCNSCYLGAEKKGKLSKETKKKECESIIMHWGVTLKRFAEIMEDNPKAFEESRKQLKPEMYFLL